MNLSPSTPVSQRTASRQFNVLDNIPQMSSPLASPETSSPVAAAQTRRRSQYKSHAPITPITPQEQPRFGVKSKRGGRLIPADTPHKVFMRERFKARCLERAHRAREQKVRSKRSEDSMSEGSSDGFDVDMDCEMDMEDDEAAWEEIANDELFSRIMLSQKRKREYAYRVSYAHDVGSSWDPDLEDIAAREAELQEPGASSLPVETTPADLEQEELDAYAEEYYLQQDLEGLDDLFELSDFEDDPTPRDGRATAPEHAVRKAGPEIVEMDTMS